ncbi:FecR family protein [Lunatibacter salilacus]|uniref:FecR family protein n=1 Tax=Lunatibacter salilacus TaxID=2483804 RepID=UPI00131E02A7|nr:FecR family protein [Lunatibacter salilacus]
MDISKYTISDFVFDNSFRSWVYEKNSSSNSHWHKLVKDNPQQRENIEKAIKILIEYQNNKEKLDPAEIWKIWEKIDMETESEEGNVVPLSSHKFYNKPEISVHRRSYFSIQGKSVAAILVVIFGLAFFANYFMNKEIPDSETLSVIIEKIETEKGTKSSFVLEDGTKVMVNAGSQIRFKKGFDGDQREIFLEGEAYFKVAKDTLKPFTVVSSQNISVTALGTSFMIQAYPGEEMKVSLLTGKVKVNVGQEKDPVYMEEGEGLKINTDTKQTHKHTFNRDQVLAWTKRTIYFDKIPISEAIRILENWYGVQFDFENSPPPDLLLTGIFENETLKNVLEGLKYTSGIQYKMEGKKAIISFNH